MGPLYCGCNGDEGVFAWGPGGKGMPSNLGKGPPAAVGINRSHAKTFRIPYVSAPNPARLVFQTEHIQLI